MPNRVEEQLDYSYLGNALGGTDARSQTFGPDVPPETIQWFRDYGAPIDVPIRSSFVELVEHCPRKALYAERLGIRPKSYEGALQIGKMLHTAMSMRGQGRSVEEQVRTLREQGTACAVKLAELADTAGYLPSGKDLKGTLQDLADDVDKVVAIIQMPIWEKALDWDQYEILVLPSTGKPMIETLITVRLRGFGTDVVAQPDLVIRHKKTGEVFIVDYKTTSKRTAIRAEGARHSVQMKIYRLCLQVLLNKEMPGTVVTGAIHIIIQKPTIKYCPLTKDKDGFPAYVKRVQDWYIENISKDPILRTEDKFHGPFLSRQLMVRLRAANKAATRNPNLDAFYQAGGDACTSYDRVCPYMRLCNSEPVVWPLLIEQYYQIRFGREDDDVEEQT